MNDHRYCPSRGGPTAAASRFVCLALAAVCLGGLAQPSLAQSGGENVCGSLKNAFGPFDYRRDRYVPAAGDNQPWEEKLHLVEKGHFTPIVETLMGGQSGHRPGPDLDYTLRAIPNHHRALVAITRLWQRERTPKPGALPRTVECYFERAIRFAGDDPITRMLYANFLLKGDRAPEALAQLKWVGENAGDSAFTHYNLGLMYLDAKRPAEALVQAHRAIELGFPRQELRERLVAMGAWTDPPPVAASQAAAGQAAGASGPAAGPVPAPPQ